MTQDKRWMARYNEVKEFIEREHRNSSKYVDSERGLELDRIRVDAINRRRAGLMCRLIDWKCMTLHISHKSLL